MNRTAFEAAFARTVGLEGGHVNDPRDRGGETKFGISKRSHPSEDIAAPGVFTNSRKCKNDSHH